MGPTGPMGNSRYRLINNSLRKCVSPIGHALTIEVLLSIDSTQKYFYSQRMTNEGNALPRTVVDATSVNSFTVAWTDRQTLERHGH